MGPKVKSTCYYVAMLQRIIFRSSFKKSQVQQDTFLLTVITVLLNGVVIRRSDLKISLMLLCP